MKSTLKKVAIFILTLSFVLIMATNAFAKTESFEVRTRSALLVDRSSSIIDKDEVNNIILAMNTTEYDFIGYFDDGQISVDSEYKGGGDSAICESIDEIAKLGYTHITVITDGEQWPKNYSSLGIYTDLDLNIVLVGNKEEQANELISQLRERMKNSNLTVVNTNGLESIVLNEYIPEVFEVEIPEIEKKQEDSLSIVDSNGKCYWWIALILAVLIAALFDFIHEIITNKSRKSSNQPIQKPLNANPMPEKAVTAINSGARVIADFSGSMADQQYVTAEVCQSLAPNEDVICFARKIKEVKPSQMLNIEAGGRTYGWEALEKAYKKGLREIVLISDLGFNGKDFSEKKFKRKFEKVTIVAPILYNEVTLRQIELIANEVEVLPLE